MSESMDINVVVPNEYTHDQDFNTPIRIRGTSRVLHRNPNWNDDGTELDDIRKWAADVGKFRGEMVPLHISLSEIRVECEGTATILIMNAADRIRSFPEPEDGTYRVLLAERALREVLATLRIPSKFYFNTLDAQVRQDMLNHHATLHARHARGYLNFAAKVVDGHITALMGKRSGNQLDVSQISPDALSPALYLAEAIADAGGKPSISGNRATDDLSRPSTWGSGTFKVTDTSAPLNLGTKGQGGSPVCLSYLSRTNTNGGVDIGGGLMRMVCSNGLMVALPAEEAESIKEAYILTATEGIKDEALRSEEQNRMREMFRFNNNMVLGGAALSHDVLAATMKAFHNLIAAFAPKMVEVYEKTWDENLSVEWNMEEVDATMLAVAKEFKLPPILVKNVLTELQNMPEDAEMPTVGDIVAMLTLLCRSLDENKIVVVENNAVAFSQTVARRLHKAEQE